MSVLDPCSELKSGGAGMGHPTPHIKNVFPNRFVAVLVLMLKQESEEFNVSR